MGKPETLGNRDNSASPLQGIRSQMEPKHLLEFQLEMQELITEREMIMVESQQGDCGTKYLLEGLTARFCELREKLTLTAKELPF